MTEIVVHPTFVSNVLEARGEIVGPRGSSGLNDAQRIALKNLLQIAAYAEDPTDEFAAFKSAFGFDAIVHVTGVSFSEAGGTLDVNDSVTLIATITPANATNQAVTWTSSDDTVASVASDGTVTALGCGSATITVTTEDGGFTAAYALTVASLSSISAVFTQGSATIYTTDTLDTLKQYLVVTATYSDSTTVVVTDYTLSGTLGEGTRTITVSYGGKSDTFNVVCTVKGWLYHFNQNLASSGSEDFGLSGENVNYVERVSGDYAYYRPIDTTVDPSATVGIGIKAVGLQTVPDFSGDFTISGFAKGSSNGFNLVTAYKPPSATTTNIPPANSGVDNLATGWTAGTLSNLSNGYKGIRIQTISGGINFALFASDEDKYLGIKLTPPTGFDLTTWHHYALTRKAGRFYFFVDGALVCTIDYDHPIYFPDQVAVCGAFKGYADRNNIAINTMDYYADELFISDYCKWDSAFDATSIVY